MVTGCSDATIGRVYYHMCKTGGLREPPEHGLKKYWQDVYKKSGTRVENKDETPPSTSAAEVILSFCYVSFSRPSVDAKA